LQFSKQGRKVMGCTRILLAALALTASFIVARADPQAYMGTDTGEFGVIDLTTGAFSLLGNSGQTLAGMAVADGDLFASAYHTPLGAVFNINPANGALTAIGNAGIDIDDFGSTTSGLFAVGFLDRDLYSINPSTGAATLIGPTGLSLGTWRGLSTNSSTLYFADGPDLYTLNTSTGAATLVGAMGGGFELGAILDEGGVLYGGAETPSLQVVTVDPVTGAAASIAPLTGATGHFYALAPNPIPTAVPELSTWALMLFGFAGLGFAGHRASMKARERSSRFC
jgi:hypothetical protein